MCHITGKNTHHILGKILRNNKGRIIFAGFNSIGCIICICKDPVEIVIFLQCLNDIITKIQIHVDQFTCIPCILAGHGNFQAIRTAIRIPAGCNIEPCIKSRNNKNTHDNDHGNNIIMNLV